MKNQRNSWPVRFLLLGLVLMPLGCAGRVAESSGTTTAQQAAIATEFQAIIETLADEKLEGRDAGTPGIDLARDYLIQRFKDAGLEPGFVIKGEPGYAQPFEVTTGRDAEGEAVTATVSNVGGLLPGIGALADQVLVVGGHYDHVGYGHFGSRAPVQRGQIHPGADDNASGTAGVVLLAQRLADYAKAHPDQPRRTVLFTCFAGEERGLLGSRYMTAFPGEWPFEMQSVAGMINLDMIGRLRDDELYIFGDESGQQWREWLKQLNESVGLDLKFDVRPPGGSDHSMFIAEGVPAVFFNTWLHEDYHTPQDTADKINAPGGAKILELVGLLIEHAATTDQRVAYQAPAAPRPQPSLGVRLAQAPGGATVQAVGPRTAAEKGGILAGDIITRFNGSDISDVGGLRSHINQSQPGQEVKVTVRRGEETLELTVTLGVR